MNFFKLDKVKCKLYYRLYLFNHNIHGIDRKKNHYTHARAHEAICFFVLEILLEPIIYLFITKLIISCKSLESAVARGGIEPPTHGFSVRFKLLLLNYIG